MPAFEKSGYAGFWQPERRLDGNHGVLVVVKRRYTASAEAVVAADGSPVRVAAAPGTQPEVLAVPVYEGEDPATASLIAPSDLAVMKAKVDLMVLGRGYAPGGTPAGSWSVAVRVDGVVERTLDIVGPRRARWVAPSKLLKPAELERGKEQVYPPPVFTQPEALTQLPLEYRLAYGGEAEVHLPPHVAAAAQEHQDDALIADARRKLKKELLADGAATPDAAGQAVGARTEVAAAASANAPAAAPLEVASPFGFEGGPEAEDSDGGAASETSEPADASAESAGDVIASPLRGPDGDPQTAGSGAETVDEAAGAAGAASVDGDAPPRVPYLANPTGMGFVVSPLQPAVDGTRLPCVEYAEMPLTPETLVFSLHELDLAALPPAAGFGPYPTTWFPRAAYAGVMPWDLDAAEAAQQAALDAYDPEDPDDQAVLEALDGQGVPVMRAEWYQDAHPLLQLDALRGDEVVHLQNMSPSGTLAIRLPGDHPMSVVDLGSGGVPCRLKLDTVLVDAREPEAPVVDLVWRGWHPLRSFDDLEAASFVEVDIADGTEDAWAALEASDALVSDAERLGSPPAPGASEEPAGDDVPLEGTGADADAAYRREVHEGRAGDARPQGPAGSTPDRTVATNKGDSEVRLSDDSWSDAARERKEALDAADAGATPEDEAARRAEAGAAADEALEIERDETE